MWPIASLCRNEPLSSTLFLFLRFRNRWKTTSAKWHWLSALFTQLLSFSLNSESISHPGVQTPPDNDDVCRLGTNRHSTPLLHSLPGAIDQQRRLRGHEDDVQEPQTSLAATSINVRGSVMGGSLNNNGVSCMKEALQKEHGGSFCRCWLHALCLAPLRHRNLFPCVKDGGGSIMMWPCNTASGPGWFPEGTGSHTQSVCQTLI